MHITGLLSRRTHNVLARAVQFATKHGHMHVDALHILRVMVDREPAADYIRYAGAEPAGIATAAEERLPEQAAPRAETTTALTPSAQRALLDAYQVARAFGSTYIDPEHVFFALVVNQEPRPGRCSQRPG